MDLIVRRRLPVIPNLYISLFDEINQEKLLEARNKYSLILNLGLVY